MMVRTGTAQEYVIKCTN